MIKVLNETIIILFFLLVLFIWYPLIDILFEKGGEPYGDGGFAFGFAILIILQTFFSIIALFYLTDKLKEFWGWIKKS